MLRAIWECYRLFQKEASAWLADECFELYSVPAIDFEVNHTDKVPGADVLGEGQHWEQKRSLLHRCPTWLWFKPVCGEQGFEDVMERSSALWGDWSI